MSEPPAFPPLDRAVQAVWAGTMHLSERMAPEAEVSRAVIAARTSYPRRALVPDTVGVAG